LWAIGRYHLGLSDKDFWKLIPANFFSLYEQYEIALEQRDFMAAQICCSIANAFRGKGKAAKVTDFMAFSRKNKKKSKQRQSMEEQMEIAKAITVAFGGAILDKGQLK
jgi:nucleoside recognition membrane protein YjiH